jgi:hypothetical protein
MFRKSKTKTKTEKAKPKKKADRQPRAEKGVVLQQAPSDIYTLILLLSAIALAVGSAMLFLEIARYGGFGAVKGPV